jgi:hypothetical protein
MSDKNPDDEMVTIRVPASAARMIEAQLAAATTPTMIAFQIGIVYFILAVFWMISLGLIGWVVLNLSNPDLDWPVKLIPGAAGCFLLLLVIPLTIQQGTYVQRLKRSREGAGSEGGEDDPA